MTEITEILNARKIHKKKFLKKFPKEKKCRVILLNYIKNPELKAKIDEACQAIGIFVLDGIEIIEGISSEEFFGAIDACVTDESEKTAELDLIFMEKIMPIFPSQSEYKLTEFNPMKFEGNAFLFDENNFYKIFEKICRMLENSQYAGDRRTIIKNLIAYSEEENL